MEVDMVESTWRTIPGYEGRYEASDRGEIRSLIVANGLPVPRLHKQNPNTSGYPIVRLSDSAHRVTTRLVHHLVALAFIGPRPAGSEVRHLDGDQTNAAAGNLAYSDHSANMKDRARHGTHRSRNTGKTHCPKGHPYDEQNTYVAPNGWRQCRICRDAARRRAR